MHRATAAFRALAIVACLCGTAVSAGNADDAQGRVEQLLNFDRPNHPEVQAARASFSGCAFNLSATFIESGASMNAALWGDLSDVRAENISRELGDPVEVLQFRMYDRPAAWGAAFEVGPQHPLFQQLSTDPTSVEFLVGDCTDTMCTATLILPGTWDHYDYTFGLTDLVTDTEADQLLTAFQNLAVLCDAQAQ